MSAACKTALFDASLPPSYYEASLGARPHYPACQGAAEYDVCVVGGGFAGLHTALNLAENGLKVVLLEARRIGWGASGRNGGHVIPEFACGMGQLESALGMPAARQCWTLARAAAQRLRDRIARYQIDCDYQPGHIEAGVSTRHVALLRGWQQHAQQHYGHDYRFISADEMPGFIGSTRYRGALLDNDGGHLHPLRLALGLARALVAAGGVVCENSPVLSWQSGNALTVRTAQGQVQARQLVLASNVGMETMDTPLAQKLAARILPVGTWMIATEPLPEDMANSLLPSRAAVADNRVVLDYFRLSADRRLLFGGGCSYLGNGTPSGFAAALRKGMLRVFPSLAEARVDYAWGGVIDISLSRAPDFGRAERGNVYYAQGFSGSGIVAACVAGRVLADAILGDAHNLDLLMRLKHRAFPGGRWLRGPMTAIGMLYHRLRDYL